MTSLEDELAALRQEYLEELPDTAARLRALLAQLSGMSQEQLQSLRSEVHKLAGNAAAFEYMDVARLAMQLDVRYTEISEQHAYAELPETASQLSALVARLDELGSPKED